MVLFGFGCVLAVKLRSLPALLLQILVLALLVCCLPGPVLPLLGSWNKFRHFMHLSDYWQVSDTGKQTVFQSLKVACARRILTSTVALTWRNMGWALLPSPSRFPTLLGIWGQEMQPEALCRREGVVREAAASFRALHSE